MSLCAGAAEVKDRPWTNRALSPDARADLVIEQMTNEEKLSLVVGTSQRPEGETVGAAGYVAGLPRLGIPMLKESNAELGVAIPPLQDTISPEDEATALPSGLATAATWNPAIAHANGAMIAEEARRKGFNVLLAGAVNLARDPRTGRNFEYAGEDPLLAGTMAGAAIRGIQDKHVISTVKHFALNDQETNRTLLDARIDMAALRESDLLAFELAIEHGRPGAVMCSYNLLDGIHACENPTLLDKVLRQDWRFPGWVMSDWGAVHSTSEAVRAGLDQESGADWDSRAYFGEPLAVAVAEGTVTTTQLNTMAHRILRTMFASGVIDNPPRPRPARCRYRYASRAACRGRRPRAAAQRAEPVAAIAESASHRRDRRPCRYRRAVGRRLVASHPDRRAGAARRIQGRRDPSLRDDLRSIVAAQSDRRAKRRMRRSLSPTARMSIPPQPRRKKPISPSSSRRRGRSRDMIRKICRCPATRTS